VNIVVLTHYFPPEVNAPAARTHEHCREWVKAGHDVTVVTCAPNHPTGVVYEGYRNKLRQEEWRDGIRVIRLWTFLAANQGFGRRTANYASYMLSSLLAAPFLPAADVVISTSPQFFCGLAGYGVSRIKRAPWILEIRDLWPETISTVGAIHSGPLLRVLEAVETWAYRHADKVVALTNAFRDHIQARGVPSSRVEVVTNGVDLSLFQREPKDASVAHQLGLEGKFVAGYLGTHGMCHKLETVLEAAKLLEHDRRIAFLLVGGGAERARLLELKERMRLANVVMLDQQPRERVPPLWSVVDVGLVLLRRSDLFKTVIPSKIFEAMAMERPIILGVEGESRRIIEDAGAGIPITPESAEELAQAVVTLADDPERARQMGRKGRRHAEQAYDRRVLAARFERIMASLLPDMSEHLSGAPLHEPSRSQR
jgi:glycosyltransferase involved in cell wall biosynthesis